MGVRCAGAGTFCPKTRRWRADSRETCPSKIGIADSAESGEWMLRCLSSREPWDISGVCEHSEELRSSSVGSIRPIFQPNGSSIIYYNYILYSNTVYFDPKHRGQVAVKFLNDDLKIATLNTLILNALEHDISTEIIPLKIKIFKNKKFLQPNIFATSTYSLCQKKV